MAAIDEQDGKFYIITGTEYAFYQRHADLPDERVQVIARVIDEYMKVQQYLRNIYNSHPSCHKDVEVPPVLQEKKRGRKN